MIADEIDEGLRGLDQSSNFILVHHWSVTLVMPSYRRDKSRQKDLAAMEVQTMYDYQTLRSGYYLLAVAGPLWRKSKNDCDHLVLPSGLDRFQIPQTTL